MSSRPSYVQTQCESEAHARVEAQMQEKCVVNSVFAPEEKESIERMLNGHYGLQWVISSQELWLDEEKCGDHEVTEP